MYVLLTATIVAGLSTTVLGNLLGHPYDYRPTIAPYFRSIFYFYAHPDVSLINAAPTGFQIHVMLAWVLFAAWPFTRLVHVLYSLGVRHLVDPAAHRARPLAARMAALAAHLRADAMERGLPPRHVQWPRWHSAKPPISISWNPSAGSCSGSPSPPGCWWPPRSSPGSPAGRATPNAGRPRLQPARQPRHPDRKALLRWGIPWQRRSAGLPTSAQIVTVSSSKTARSRWQAGTSVAMS